MIMCVPPVHLYYKEFFSFFPGSKDHEWIRRWKIMIICCSSHKFPFSPSFSFILRPVRIFQLLLILILNTEWQMICLDLSSHVSGTGTFPELGTTLMKDFYTKLFPERSRSRSGTRNMERGTWPRSTFPASMLLITWIQSGASNISNSEVTTLQRLKLLLVTVAHGIGN